ncbi:MAG: ABC transporter permease [Acidobacteria bacterium]|nr:ABC transporter permease [Acidobacteriota bacterium]
MALRFLAKHAVRLVLTVLIAGLLGAALVRIAPAFGVSEQELDPRLSREFVQGQRPEPVGILRYYGQFLYGVAHGDFGESPSLQRPIGELLRERLPVSLENLAFGAGAGIVLGFLCAMVAVVFRSPLARAVPVASSTVLLSLPSAALGLLFLLAGWPPAMALTAVVFPRVYRYSAAVLARSADASHVLAARARGVSPGRILCVHVLPGAAPQLLAIVGMAISLGFPALVPIEAVCDSPGVMQLALKAAMARDLPLLVVLTMVASVVVLIGNAAADISSDVLRRES